MTIFVTAPVDELERRLRERATESSGRDRGADRRPRGASCRAQDQFDYVVENDDRERAAERLAAIIARELDRAATMARQ